MTGPDQRRLTMADHYDAELHRHHERFLAAMALDPTDRVLDVGCGAGRSTRDAARAARSGSVLGVDVSEPMIDRARQLTAHDGLTNVTYEVGDAQVHQFAPGSFDVVISRFGTMFFTDPVVAFTNLATAARPGARLVMMVWQSHDRNEWATEVHQALTPGIRKPDRSGPFSLADPSVVEAVLAAAGFTKLGFKEVDEPVYYGPNSSVAYDLVLSLKSTRDVLAALDRPEADRALARLRSVLAARDTGEGVWFDSRAWIVTGACLPSRRYRPRPAEQQIGT